jgi:hypothetical protein
LAVKLAYYWDMYLVDRMVDRKVASMAKKKVGMLVVKLVDK